ncbi:phytase [Talaromyces islandicus]|uniref:Phytase A n=1 Tax=Talaromyces islandicus TaxID=28573 RepID=A0A0U1M3F0_TALIS|nr:phytase [Talaromyces islandicus]
MDSKLPVRRQDAYHIAEENMPQPSASRRWKRTSVRQRLALLATAVLGLLFFIQMPTLHSTPKQAIPRASESSTGAKRDYLSRPKVSHYWGQYSPFFSLEKQSEISTAVPPTCQIVFAQVLARHGARYPTSSKREKYVELIDTIHKQAKSYEGDYAVLKDYKIQLGADDLTRFGEQEMFESGKDFYARYMHLARDNVPFVRSSGSSRVVASGEFFNKGFQAAKGRDRESNKTQQSPIINTVIPEGEEFNNTLDAGSCKSFTSDPKDVAQDAFLKVFAPQILKKITAGLPGVELENKHVPLLMDLCPFETVAQNSTGSLSPLCRLFTLSDWQAYDYYNTLDKFYGYGKGNPLGPTQGVGFVNEVIARMTHSPVKDHTSVNQTLDSDPATFSLDATLYADFSHDNTITSIYYALGLYNDTASLPTNQSQSVGKSHGYSASWTVPFSSRAYIEMMQCGNHSTSEPLVRILVNDRVVPLSGCNADALGRCKRDDWIQSLEFARSGGEWGSC